MFEKRMLACINPATGEKVDEFPMSTADDALQARQEMGVAAKIWARKPVKKRVRILRQFQKLLIDSADQITETLNIDCGKSRQDALIELFITVNLLDEYCKKAETWLRRRRVSPGLYMFKTCYVEQRPYGVVAVIGPWNYPFVLTVPPVLTALLAGNTVILKPSEETGLTGKLIENLFSRVPELAPFVRVLHGDGRVGAALVDSKPDLIFLTGSTQTGRLVSKAAAEHMIPLISELGGKDPLIVLEDADLDAAARWSVWGACFNAGQTCMAVERVYVIDKVYDEFMRHAVHYAQEFKMGYSPAKNSPYLMGPLTTERQVAIVDRHLQDALEKGAKVLVGGHRRGHFVEPTILADVTHAMLVMREETFGPIMPIMKVRDEAEAIRLANDSEYGLGASVWSQDLEHAGRVLQKLEAGTLQVNDTLSHFAVPNLPFGGVKKSGQGRVHGESDLLQFTQAYAITLAAPPMLFDVATQMRLPGRYGLGVAMMKVVFGVSPRQKLEPVTDLVIGRAGTRTVGRAVVTTGALAAAAALVLRVVRKR